MRSSQSSLSGRDKPEETRVIRERVCPRRGFAPSRVLSGIKDESSGRAALIVQVEREYRNPGRIGLVRGTVVGDTYSRMH